MRGLTPDAAIKTTVDKFKWRIGFWLHTQGRNEKIQKDYYDHVIRIGQDWRAQAIYIALNPVRAGIVENPFDYAKTGCIGSNREEMLEEIFFGSSKL